MLQNKHRGATCQTFLFLLSNPLNFNLRRSFLIEARNTHFRPKTTNRNIHSFLFYHNISRYEQDSSLSLKQLHLFTIVHLFFIRISIVKIFFHNCFLTKKVASQKNWVTTSISQSWRSLVNYNDQWPPLSLSSHKFATLVFLREVNLNNKEIASSTCSPPPTYLTIIYFAYHFLPK